MTRAFAVHDPASSRAHEQGWRGTRGLWTGISGVFTGVAERLMHEAGEGRGGFDAGLDRPSGRGCHLARCRSSLAAHPIHEHAEPQQSEEQKHVEKWVVSHMLSLP
jgi:hypothetical protein